MPPIRKDSLLKMPPEWDKVDLVSANVRMPARLYAKLKGLHGSQSIVALIVNKFLSQLEKQLDQYGPHSFDPSALEYRVAHLTVTVGLTADEQRAIAAGTFPGRPVDGSDKPLVAGTAEASTGTERGGTGPVAQHPPRPEPVPDSPSVPTVGGRSGDQERGNGKQGKKQARR